MSLCPFFACATPVLGFGVSKSWRLPRLVGINFSGSGCECSSLRALKAGTAVTEALVKHLPGTVGVYGQLAAGYHYPRHIWGQA